jgi:tripartite-type tricarboxylate transporter receptor subunit TctC
MKTASRAYGAVLACVAGIMLSPGAMAQTYPTKSVRIIVNYTPGGPTDLVARTMGAKMGEMLGQTFVVENMPSANGTIGTQTASRAAHDGHTLLFSTAGHTSVALALFGPKLGFDPLRDITPIGKIVDSTQMIVAHPSLGARTIPELVKIAKARPGQINFGSVGVGSSNHLGIELLKSMAGIDMLHVPYKGTAPVMQDLMAGRVQLMLNSMGTVIQHVRSGKLVGLAVGTTTRSAAAPDVPTMEELGYKGYQVSTWYAFFAPAKTPAPVIGKLNATLNQALADPQLTKTFGPQGFEAAPGTPEALGKLMRDEYERWKKVIADAKITAE